MKTLIIFAAIASLTTSAFGACRIKLDQEGLTPSQVSEVKTILTKKGYTVAKGVQGNETEFLVRIFKVTNCVPGFDEIYQTGGGYEIYSAAYNIDVRNEGRFSRMNFQRNQFNRLKAGLGKIPACR